MVFAYPLVRGNVAEHVILLLVGSSHADWTYQALLRCKLFAFFSKLLVDIAHADVFLREE